MSRFGRVLFWFAIVLVVACAGLYASLYHGSTKKNPVFLLACIEVDPAPLSWACEHALRRAALTPQTVDQLNAEAGAQYPLIVTDRRKAEELLELFLARGVDINAAEQQVVGWTALHMAALRGDVTGAQLLLEHGADPAILDASGRTPLDWAREKAAKHPSVAAHAQMVELLKNVAEPAAVDGKR